ncbi:MAG: lytic transglycosylase domain-containing protein [Sulfuricella denitrificans]|nr:lytic transglycosylase domain-containing protein [Sulfuricella denitrificans]
MAMCMLPFSAKADIYHYTDAKGIVHFSNVPDNRQYRLIIATQSGESRQTVAASASRAPAQVSRAGKARFSSLVEDAARTHQVDPALLHAVITAESGYNPAAVSRKGAIGLMQLMPETAQRYGVENSYDPAQNINGGTRYLSDLLQMFNNNIELAVAAYNAGENAVIRHGYSIPPYRETLAYVPRVLNLQKRYRSVL